MSTGRPSTWRNVSFDGPNLSPVRNDPVAAKTNIDALMTAQRSEGDRAFLDYGHVGIPRTQSLNLLQMFLHSNGGRDHLAHEHFEDRCRARPCLIEQETRFGDD